LGLSVAYLRDRGRNGEGGWCLRLSITDLGDHCGWHLWLPVGDLGDWNGGSSLRLTVRDLGNGLCGLSLGLAIRDLGDCGSDTGSGWLSI